MKVVLGAQGGVEALAMRSVMHDGPWNFFFLPVPLYIALNPLTYF